MNGRSTATYMVERYLPGVPLDELSAAIGRARRVAEDMTRAGIEVRHLLSTLVPAEEAMVCLFDAASADAIVEVNRRAGLPFDRVVAALVLSSLDLVDVDSNASVQST